MGEHAGRSPLPGPGPRIGIFALVAGTLSFLAGFVGPLFLSSSNLGPLLGIFVTGPVGAAGGALVGCVVWAKRAKGHWVTAVWKWIAGIWILDLLYTLFVLRFGPLFTLAGVAVQLMILGAVAILLYHPDTRIGLPHVLRKCGPVVLLVAVVTVLTTVFPPVARPWWGSQTVHSASAASPLPFVAFMFHSGFDASHHIPQFAVNLPVLILEWVAAMVGGAVACSLIALRVKSGGFPGSAGAA